MADEQAPMVPGSSTPEEIATLLRRLKIKKWCKKSPPDPKFGMTAMIDIVFLLIFFFMVVTDMSKMEIESVALPFAIEASDDTGKDDRVIINITDKGKIRYMRRDMTEADLGDLLKKAADNSPREDDLPTISCKIRADSNAEYKFVQQVMVQCMRAYIWKLSFGARPVADEDALERTFGKF